MYAIETPNGRYEGATEKEARRLARAGERAARKAAAGREARQKLARTRAEAKGYRILVTLRTEATVVGRWWMKPFGTRFCRVTRGERGDLAHYDCADGSATYDHNGYRVLGILADAGGLDFAVFTRDEHTGEEYALAIGAEGDVLGFADLPGVTMADFAASDHSIEAEPESAVA